MNLRIKGFADRDFERAPTNPQGRQARSFRFRPRDKT